MSESSVPVVGMIATLDKPMVCPVLVGREEQVAVLARYLDEVRAGAGQVAQADGWRDDAEHAFVAARAIIAELAAEVPDDELRQTFFVGRQNSSRPRRFSPPGTPQRRRSPG